MQPGCVLLLLGGILGLCVSQGSVPQNYAAISGSALVGSSIGTPTWMNLTAAASACDADFWCMGFVVTSSDSVPEASTRVVVDLKRSGSTLYGSGALTNFQSFTKTVLPCTLCTTQPNPAVSWVGTTEIDEQDVTIAVQVSGQAVTAISFDGCSPQSSPAVFVDGSPPGSCSTMVERSWSLSALTNANCSIQTVETETYVAYTFNLRVEAFANVGGLGCANSTTFHQVEIRRNQPTDRLPAVVGVSGNTAYDAFAQNARTTLRVGVQPPYQVDSVLGCGSGCTIQAISNPLCTSSNATCYSDVDVLFADECDQANDNVGVNLRLTCRPGQSCSSFDFRPTTSIDALRFCTSIGATQTSAALSITALSNNIETDAFFASDKVTIAVGTAVADAQPTNGILTNLRLCVLPQADATCAQATEFYRIYYDTNSQSYLTQGALTLVSGPEVVHTPTFAIQTTILLTDMSARLTTLGVGSVPLGAEAEVELTAPTSTISKAAKADASKLLVVSVV